MRPLLRVGEISGVDGFRAISIGLVLAAHYGFERVIPGGLGVTLFFFISGFLITTLLLREIDANNKIDIKKFYIRRFLRLQPELLTFIILKVFFIYPQSPPIEDTLAAIFYYTNYHQILWPPPDPINGFRFVQLWSLAVEEHYYITYPILFALIYKFKKNIGITLTSICIISLSLRQIYWSMGFSPDYAYQATETRIDSIAYGCLAALLLWHHGSRLQAIAGGPRSWALLAFGSGVLLASLFLRDPWFRETIRFSMQGIGLIAVFVSLQSGTAGVVLNPWLDIAPMRWIGRMSYAAYLWHLEPEHLLARFVDFAALRTSLPGTLLAGAILLTATFAAAFLSHLLIYRSFLGLRRRYGSHA
jgi:peptidoglycan/LPS O-acetylase OafA/YrhL